MIKSMVKTLTASGYAWVKTELSTPIVAPAKEVRAVSNATGVLHAK